jgi:21S rRNA (GM2251-2'-O)-methyltransferase
MMPIISVESGRGFLSTSRENGWAIYAGVTPEPISNVPAAGGSAARSPESPVPNNSSNRDMFNNLEHGFTSAPVFSDAQTSHKSLVDHVPLVQHPSILVFGGEGRGLRKTLYAHADYFVSMNPAKRALDVGVDSLNVSVAASVIAAEFLRRPSLEVSEKNRARMNSIGDLGF